MKNNLTSIDEAKDQLIGKIGTLNRDKYEIGIKKEFRRISFISEKLTYSPMKGKQGRCFAAQVWDSEGNNLASIDSRYGARKATKYAKLFASAPNLYKDLKSMVLSITSHPDYILGTDDDEWHTLVGLAEKTLKKAK